MELRARRIGARLTIAGEGGVRITLTRKAF
jgi:galactokinase